VPGSVSAERTPTGLAVRDAAGSANYLFDIEWHIDGTRAYSSTPPWSVIASETVAHSMQLPRPRWAEVERRGDVVARGV